MKVINYGGIKWVPSQSPTPTWYYHAGEGAVFPYEGYHRLHQHHAVLPVEPEKGV